MLKALLIFLGAGGGGVLRYVLGGLLQAWWGPSFPVGTLAVNVSGCLAMGLLAGAFPESSKLGDQYRALMFIGVLGGYTTFSSFGRETMTLLQEYQYFRAAAYVLASNVLGLGATLLGYAAVQKLLTPHGAA